MSDHSHSHALPDGVPVLTTAGLVVGYGGRGLLPPLDVRIEPRQFVALVGPNGGGKSTLVRTVLGLLPPVGGSISWAPGAHISFVAQRSAHDLAVPGRVTDFVAGGLDHDWSFLTPRRGARAAVAAALDKTGAKDLGGRRMAELSEGQRQRVLLARALVCQPAIIVLDEPTAAMDANAQRETFELLKDLADQQGVAVLIATHQMALAAQFATHAVMLDAADGVALAGPAEAIWSAEAFGRRYGGWSAGASPGAAS